ncbi:autophagy-related protein 11-domain-containing protein [Kalaharituber pfeilii]|nr:autophagy-related protein 11-domain-containing protein [Kalaharituber pfeilii]
MSLVIITAKDGAQYQADPRTLANIKELKVWIEDHAKVAVANQILLSGRGMQVRETTLATEKEIFVFDRKLLDHNAKPPLIQKPPIVNQQAPPADIQTPKDHSAWVNTFRNHLQWADSVVTKGKSLAAAISNAEAQIKNIQRSVSVASDNLENHVNLFQRKLHEKQEDARSSLRKQEEVFTNWEKSVRIATQISVHTGFISLAQRQAQSPRNAVTLADLISVAELKKAAAAAELKAQAFVTDMEKLSSKVEEITKKTAMLRDDIQQTSVGSSGNYQNSERVQDAHSLAQVAKWAQTHFKDFLPGLSGLLTEMSRLQQQAIAQKNNVILAAHKNLTSVVSVQSSLGFLQPQFEKVVLPESDSFLLLARAHRLPYVYGALLVECVRRREWTERLTTESKRLAEDLASLKSEEEKRRKKWQKQVGQLLPFTLGGESKVLSLEINLEGLEDRWPQVTRQDVETFLEQCKNIPAMGESLKEVTQLYQDLDKPLRKQSRKVKGFKLGSVHEATMGASSIFGEDTRELQEKIAFLENQDLNQKSRIRKLEDLLHRAFGRAGAGAGIPPSSPVPGQYPPPLVANILGSSPSMNGLPQQGTPSVNARRLSSNLEQSERERSQAARMLSLETELNQERELTAQLQKEAAERATAEKEINERFMEADHTKNDLLANLEAQQQEFVLERKELQRGIEELRTKLDEAYEDLDRAEEMKSAEIERKSALEARISALEDELVRAVEEKEDWQKKYSDEVEKLKKERDEGAEHVRKYWEEEKARNTSLEALISTMKEEISNHLATIGYLESALKDAQGDLEEAKQQQANAAQAQATSLTKLQQAHRTLAPHDNVPRELRLLADTIEVLALKAVGRHGELQRRYDELENTTQNLRASIEQLQSRFDSRTIRAKDLTQRLYTHNARSTQLLESLGFLVLRRDNTMQIVRLSRSGPDSLTMSKSVMAGAASSLAEPVSPTASKKLITSASALDDINLLYWMETNDSDTESEKYAQYLNSIGTFDLDAFSDAIIKRVKEAEHMARKWQKEAKAYREKTHQYRAEAHDKIAFRSFKEGDLALFLPTRNIATRPWIAFNVGAPNYYLKEQEAHKLKTREWLLARITKVEERVVDLSRSTSSLHANASAASDSASIDDENPFELSDGLRWYLLEAGEEKPMAPTTPGLSSSTVSSSNIDAKGLKSKKPVTGAKKTLSNIQGEHRRRDSNSSVSRASIFSIVNAPSKNNANGGPVEEGPSNSAAATAGGSKASTPAQVPATAAEGTASRPPLTVPPTSSGSMAELENVMQSRML